MAGWSVLQTNCTKSGFKDCFNDSLVGMTKVFMALLSFSQKTKKGNIFKAF